MRAFVVEGPEATVIIERERRRQYAIRYQEMPAAFYLQKFRLLSHARIVAESYAGVMPYFLRRDL
jgi:hypothetical protein